MKLIRIDPRSIIIPRKRYILPYKYISKLDVKYPRLSNTRKIGIERILQNGEMILIPYFVQYEERYYFTDSPKKPILAYKIDSWGIRSLNSEVKRYEVIIRKWLQNYTKTMGIKTVWEEPPESPEEKNDKELRRLVGKGQTLLQVTSPQNKKSKDFIRLRDAIISKDTRTLKDILKV